MKTTVPKKLIKKAEKLIKDKSLSLTEPRKNILGFLLKKHGPFSVEEIHNGIGNKSCDLATVYRCIVQFENSNLVERCYLGDEILRYEYKDRDHHHHHIICSPCGEILDFHLSEKIEKALESSLKEIADNFGFSIDKHRLDLLGTCGDCTD